MNQDIPNVFHPGEQIISENRTFHHSVPHHFPDGLDGLLLLTNKRLIFLKRRSGLKMLIKLNEPKYDFEHGVYLNNIAELSVHGMLEKYLSVNGKRYYMKHIDYRKLIKMIKSASKNVQNPHQPQPPIQPIAYKPNSQQTPINNSPNTNNIFCSQCGKPNSAESRFCIGCGNELH